MAKSQPGIWSLVAVPAALTLLVTIVRLVGELQGWSPALFSTEAGGGGAAIGITWLVFVFGFWFGWKLRKTGASSVPAGRAALIYAAAIAVLAGGGYGLLEAGMVVFPTEETPGKLEGGVYLLGLLGIGVVLALAAWPRLTLTLMAYGVLARLPVAALGYLDVTAEWGTHYGKLPPFAQTDSQMEMIMGLVMPQVTLWPFAFTPIVGGLFGCIGAAVAGPKR